MTNTQTAHLVTYLLAGTDTVRTMRISLRNSRARGIADAAAAQGIVAVKWSLPRSAVTVIELAEEERCASRNGTYACRKPAGHTLLHEAPYRHGAEMRTARWETNYGPVRFYRKAAKA